MVKRDFIWQCNSREPHQLRRRDILQKHPEMRTLFGPDANSKWICLVLVTTQLYLSVALRHVPWLPYGLVVYTVGATITQALFLAIHETTHNLMFKASCANRWFSMFLNLPIVIPFSIAFRHYHLDHHKHQGVEGLDTDLPTDVEKVVVDGRLSKFIWMAFHIVMYAARPVIHGTNPVRLTPLLACNINIQLIFDVVIWKLYGPGPLLYLVSCVLIAGGLHPCGGHFLSEHYAMTAAVTEQGQAQETFSYYGPLNWLTWNVGYHNEHHDFPYVSGSRLPLVYKTAPEFYDSLLTCESWSRIIYRYIMTPSMGPHRRVKRMPNRTRESSAWVQPTKC